MTGCGEIEQTIKNRVMERLLDRRERRSCRLGKMGSSFRGGEPSCVGESVFHAAMRIEHSFIEQIDERWRFPIRMVADRGLETGEFFAGVPEMGDQSLS
jgi:hypothetical protein